MCDYNKSLETFLKYIRHNRYAQVFYIYIYLRIWYCKTRCSIFIAVFEDVICYIFLGGHLLIADPFVSKMNLKYSNVFYVVLD